MSTQTKQVKFHFERPNIQYDALGLTKHEKEEFLHNETEYQEFVDEQMIAIFNLLLVTAKEGETILLEGSGLDLEVRVDKVDRAEEIINTTIIKSNQTHERGWVVGSELTLHDHLCWFHTVTVL